MEATSERQKDESMGVVRAALNRVQAQRQVQGCSRRVEPGMLYIMGI